MQCHLHDVAASSCDSEVSSFPRKYKGAETKSATSYSTDINNLIQSSLEFSNAGWVLVVQRKHDVWSSNQFDRTEHGSAYLGKHWNGLRLGIWDLWYYIMSSQFMCAFIFDHELIS